MLNEGGFTKVNEEESVLVKSADDVELSEDQQEKVYHQASNALRFVNGENLFGNDKFPEDEKAFASFVKGKLWDYLYNETPEFSKVKYQVWLNSINQIINTQVKFITQSAVTLKFNRNLLFSVIDPSRN